MRKGWCLWIAGLAVLLLLPVMALGEGICGLQDFLSRFDGPGCVLPEAKWLSEPGGISTYAIGKEQGISVVAEKGQVICVTAVLAGENKAKAEKILLGLLAALDADAEELRIGTAVGESRNSLYLCSPDEFDRLCWQPMLGGKKYHKTAGCNMDGPRLVTPEAAQTQGFDPCGRCWPKKKK